MLNGDGFRASASCSCVPLLRAAAVYIPNTDCAHTRLAKWVHTLSLSLSLSIYIYLCSLSLSSVSLFHSCNFVFYQSRGPAKTKALLLISIAAPMHSRTPRTINVESHRPNKKWHTHTHTLINLSRQSTSARLATAHIFHTYAIEKIRQVIKCEQ